MAKGKRVNRAVRSRARSAISIVETEAPLPVLQPGLRVIVTGSHPVWHGKKGVVRWVGQRSHPLDECAVQLAIRGAGYDRRELLIRVSSSFLAPVVAERVAVPEHDAYQRASQHNRGYGGEILPAVLPGGYVVTTPPVYQERVLPGRTHGRTWSDITHDQVVAAQRERLLWLGK